MNVKSFKNGGRSGFVCFAILICLALGSERARSQESLLIFQQFSQLISETSIAVQEAIAALEDSGTTLSFNVRTDLIVVLQNLQKISKQIADGTLDRVDQSVVSSLKGVKDIVEEFNNGNAQALERLEGTTLSFGEAISRVPGISDQPFVLRYTPGLALSRNESGPGTRISVTGTLFGDTDPSLRFQSGECELKTHTERVLEFFCKDKIANDDDPWASGTLTLSYGGLFGYFFQDEKEYRLSIRAIDNFLGNFEVTTVRSSTSVTRVPREQRNYHENDHCSGNRPITWTYNPAANCEIDVVTVKDRLLSAKANTSYTGLSNVTNTGFQVKGVAKNNGECVKVLGKIVSKDGRGSMNVEVKWTDICTVVKQEPGSEHSGRLMWGVDTSVNIESETTGFVLTVKQANGSVKVITGEESGALQGANDNSWFDVTWQPKSQALVISPKRLFEAFQ